MQRILRAKIPITGIENSVLITLADMIDGKGYCYPSRNTIVVRSKFSLSTVKRTIVGLRKKGLITVEEKQGCSHRYYINIHIIESYGEATTTLPSVHTEPTTRFPESLPSALSEPQIYKGIYNLGIDKGIEPNSTNCEIKKKPITPNIGKEKDVDVSETLKHIAQGKSSLKKKAKSSPTDIYRSALVTWRKENGIHSTLGIFTQKQVCMLNLINKKLGEDYLKVVKGTLSKWSDFGVYLKKHYDYKGIPSTPHLPFFVMYIQEARDFCYEEIDINIKTSKKKPLHKF